MTSELHSVSGPASYSVSGPASYTLSIAGPTVWNSLPDSLRDPAVGPDQFRRDLKTHLFEFSALAVFSRNALYKSTFYLLTYNELHSVSGPASNTLSRDQRATLCLGTSELHSVS